MKKNKSIKQSNNSNKNSDMDKNTKNTSKNKDCKTNDLGNLDSNEE